MLKKSSKLCFVDIGVIILIECFKCFPYGLPLLTNLLYKFLEHITLIDHNVCYNPDISSLFLFLFFKVYLILGVTPRIVSEDETCQVMNFIAHPFAEVGIIDFASAILSRINIFHNFKQVGILYGQVGAIDRHEIFRFNPAVMVHVKC